MISVITCTHNPRPQYLARVLRGLREQTLACTEWEYIIVDNASAADRLPRADLAWHPQARIIREETLGLTAARLRGIREARGGLLVFVDDDNVLDADFLGCAAQIARDRAFLGAWSGQCRPNFDEPPPEWSKPYWGNLVIREFADDRWSNLPLLPETMPCGAGLCVRREVAEHYVALHEGGYRRIMLDRTGSSLMSGGDNDLAACACDIGLGVGLFSRLKLNHLIPPERLRMDYLAGLSEGIAYSGVILRSFRERGTAGRKSRTMATKIANCVRMLRMNRVQRRMFRAWNRGECRANAYLAGGEVSGASS